MPQDYQYMARTLTGEATTGIITANNAKEVAQNLRNRQLRVVRIKEYKSQGSTRGRKPGIKDVAVFSRQLATMISSGIPLLGALDTLAKAVENPRMGKIVRDVYNEVQQGNQLSLALEPHKKLFGPLYVNMIRAAEVGGGIDTVLERLSAFLEKDLALRGKIKSSLTYPVSVMIIAFVITYFMLAVIVPKFAEILAQLGTELPLITKILLVLSDGTRTMLIPTILLVIALTFGYRKLISTEAGRYQVDAFKLKIPLIGAVIQRGAIANFTSTLGLLLRNGVNIIEALDITRTTAGNAVVERAVRNASINVQTGEMIAPTLKTTPVFTPMVVSMIQIGEETGALDEMLFKAAEYYEREVEEAIDALTAGIEPALMVFLGIVIGGIVIGLFMPLFSVLGTLSNG